MNRLASHIEMVRGKFSELDADAQTKLDTEMAVAFDEHFAYQNAQARAHAAGRLTTEEAQIVYHALGEVGSEENGGWAAGTDTPTKVSVTVLMGQILGR